MIQSAGRLKRRKPFVYAVRPREFFAMTPTRYTHIRTKYCIFTNTRVLSYHYCPFRIRFTRSHEYFVIIINYLIFSLAQERTHAINHRRRQSPGHTAIRTIEARRIIIYIFYRIATVILSSTFQQGRGKKIDARGSHELPFRFKK